MQLVHENYNFAILKKHKNTFILFSENQVENVDKIMFIFSVFRLDIWIMYGKWIFFLIRFILKSSLSTSWVCPAVMHS